MPSKKFKPNDLQSGATYDARTGTLTLHNNTQINLDGADRPRSYLAACKLWDELRARAALGREPYQPRQPSSHPHAAFCRQWRAARKQAREPQVSAAEVTCAA